MLSNAQFPSTLFAGITAIRQPHGIELFSRNQTNASLHTL